MRLGLVDVDGPHGALGINEAELAQPVLLSRTIGIRAARTARAFARRHHRFRFATPLCSCAPRQAERGPFSSDDGSPQRAALDGCYAPEAARLSRRRRMFASHRERPSGPAVPTVRFSSLISKAGSATGRHAPRECPAHPSHTNVNSCLFQYRCISRPPGIAAKASAASWSVAPWNFTVQTIRRTAPAAIQPRTSASSRSG